MFKITKQQFDGVGINLNKKEKKNTLKFMTNVKLQRTERSLFLFCSVGSVLFCSDEKCC